MSVQSVTTSHSSASLGNSNQSGQPDIENRGRESVMSGQSIVCFAKDWSEDPTCNNHIMIELAKNNRVLWLNSVSTRAPNLASGRDIKKIFSKIASFFKGAEQVQNNLWVYTPIVLPFPHSRWATAINRWILRVAIKRLRRKLGMRQFQLWIFLPSAGVYAGKLGESLSVYYCTDEWSQFNYVDGPKTAAVERELIRKVDLVFATAQSLVDGRLPINPQTHLARHGVDHPLFAAALLPGTPVPQDIASIRQPILGFYGTVQDWIDFELIEYLASRHPEWSIVLIGKILVDVSGLKKYANIHLLGRREHSQLPNYCKGFAVGIIPYLLNERLLHVNPIKLREYLSAGLPVVSTCLPETQRYPGLCVAAKNPAEFEAAVAEALATDTPQLRRARSDAMREETWEHRVADLSRRIMGVMESKTASGR